MASGDIHNATGTVCEAETDESCPYGGAGHSRDLESFADHHGVDRAQLVGLASSGHINPKAAVDLIGQGIGPNSVATVSRTSGDENRAKRIEEARAYYRSEQERYSREIAQYAVDLKAYEDYLAEDYAEKMANRVPFSPQPEVPPLRRVYPKAIEPYASYVVDELPDESPGGVDPGVWSEYLTKRRRMTDGSKEQLFYI